MTSDSIDLSVIVVVFRMQREAPRTLFSLSRQYQRNVSGLDYEVLVMENPSDAPLPSDLVASFGPEFRHHRMEAPSPSPASAINQGARLARGKKLCIIVDGARIVTPGLLSAFRLGARLHDQAIVATLAWHLGPQPQQFALETGYNQAEEDRLLSAIDWRRQGYRLFEISVFAPSSQAGFFGEVAESNALLLNRDLFDRLGGYDERFQEPGGGLVNLDFFKRAVEDSSTQLVVLLDEGSFHQIHSGATTGGSGTPAPTWEHLQEEYASLHGKPWSIDIGRPLYLGTGHRASLTHLQRSLQMIGD